MGRISTRSRARPARGLGTAVRAIWTAGFLLTGTALGGTLAAKAEVAGPEPIVALPPARSPEPALDVAGALPAPAHDPELALLTAPPMSPSPGLAHAKPASPSWPSGLPWRSGASCGHPAFEAWRGRKLDVQVQFVWHDSWDQMAARLNSSYFRTALTWTPQPIVSLAMLPTSARQQHAACAQGAFDGYFRQFGQILTASRRRQRHRADRLGAEHRHPQPPLGH